MVQSERFAKKVQQWSCAGRKGPLAKGTPGHGVDWCGNGDRPLFGVGTLKEPRSRVGDVEKEPEGKEHSGAQSPCFTMATTWAASYLREEEGVRERLAQAGQLRLVSVPM